MSLPELAQQGEERLCVFEVRKKYMKSFSTLTGFGTVRLAELTLRNIELSFL